MPHHRHKKKGIRNRLRNFFPFLHSKRHSRDYRDKESIAGLRFLTIEEVKSALAGVPEADAEPAAPVGQLYSSENPEPLTAEPKGVHHHRKKRRPGSRVGRFFRQLFFPSKRKHHSTSHNNSQHLSDSNPEGPGSANSAVHASSEIPPALLQAFAERDRNISHRKPKKKRKRRSFRLFRRKKVVVDPLIAFKAGEMIEEEKPKVSWKVYLRPALNSTVMFMIAYQVSWLIYQLAVMLVASASQIDSVLFYYEVMFPIGNHSPKWNQTNIIFITLAGPLISLIFWAIYRFIFLERFHPGPQMRTFLVWLYLNSMMLFFGAFVGGAITRQGFGYVVDWLYMNIAVRILFSMIFLLLIIWISWNVVKYLPESGGPDSWKNNRFAYVLSRLIIPWFIGGGIMVLLKYTTVIPQHENIFNYDAISLATLLFAVVPPLFNARTSPHLIQGRRAYPRVHRVTVAFWTVVAIAFVLLIRIGLTAGMYFKLIFQLEIGRYY